MNISRRDMMRLAALGVFAGPASGWMGSLAARAGEGATGKRKSCILLYMNGGPSHVDTFDIKPEQSEFKAISTAVPGIQVSEHLPLLAKQMKDIAIIRGMSTNEGSHARANYMMHTGYREGVGGVIHPTLGSLASASIGDKDPELPNFISIDSGGKGNGKRSFHVSYLGPEHSPLQVHDPARGVENLKPDGPMPELERSAGLLDELEQSFLTRTHGEPVEAHRDAYKSAVRLMKSSKAKAFDIASEPDSVKKLYGDHKFGEGCMLARRLVQIGVPFVEVDLGGWDTHQNNFERVKTLSDTLDRGMAGLIQDLRSHGMLDDTLIVWMGDFGRDPHIKNGGRGHYPKAWSSVLAGGGLKTGQVIGNTNKTGAGVENRPVNVKDFMATICLALNIDINKEFVTRTGRPMRAVDKGENPIKELLA
jgi:hypothetical protein